MSKITEKSIKIENHEVYKFRLEMDDIVGIIRLTKNDPKPKHTRITDRNIPIIDETKWQFHIDRTGYQEHRGKGKFNFIGSFIDRDVDKENYNKWKKFITDKYKYWKSMLKFVD